MVVGSGSLARAVVNALAVSGPDPLSVTILARSAPAAARLAYVAGTRAALAGTPVRLAAAPVEVAATDQLAEVLAQIAPAVVLLAASVHSPWEGVDRPSPWTRWVDRAGFGVTTPLHALLAIRVAEAVGKARPEATYVNACFPDAVNPLLATLGLRIDCGIGNVAIIAASLQAALGLRDQSELTVLAHHVHLHAPAEPAAEARAWVGTEAVTDVTARLAAQRSSAGREVNEVTGYAAAQALAALATGRALDTHLPGPHGRPGGYPVRLRDGAVHLRLPPGIDEATAVAWNHQAGLADGLAVSGDQVLFGPAARAALDEDLPHLAAGFPVADTEAAGTALLELRARLRAA